MMKNQTVIDMTSAYTYDEAACRRIINADRIGWRKHGNPVDYRLVLDFYAA